jgi:hypothetical protein
VLDTRRSVDTAAETAPHAVPASDQQQQQQQQSSNKSSNDASGLFVVIQPKLVQPLVLTLVQLCRHERTSLQVVESCVATLAALFNDCQNMAACMWEEALRVTGYLELMTNEQKAAAAEVRSSCKAVLGDLTETLLCRLGPEVLRAVRKVEKLPGSGQPSASSRGSSRNGNSRNGSSSNSSRSGLQPADKVALADSVMASFGNMVLQYLLLGELTC